MIIDSLHIKNLRSYKDTTITITDYTCFVGANGAGKSTVLCALNIFFRETESSSTNLSNLEKEDFHQANTSDPIEITVTFRDLSNAEKEEFSEYYRQDVLIVTAKATFDPAAGHAAVKQYGNRLGLSDFMEFFMKLGDGAKVSELQELYAALKGKRSDLPAAKTKDAMVAALREYEQARPNECILIPSEDQFYGITQGQGRLRKYLQWVYVPAVKDASGEQSEGKNTALGKLLARTVRTKVSFSDRLSSLRSEAQEKYRQMMIAEQAVLDDISKELQSRLSEWSQPDVTAKLNWHEDPKTSVRIEEPVAHLLAGDAEFEGSIARFGHGMQRSYIIALLQVLASGNNDENVPKLVLGVEEPELYQHPPQARHLSTVLQQLSKNSAQVLVSTHSPYFVDGAGFEKVRLVRKIKNEKRSFVSSCTLNHLGTEYARVTQTNLPAVNGTMAKLHQVMQPHLSEMFFSPKIVLVEGLEDCAYINAWMLITNLWQKFRASGCHVIAANGKSELIRPLIIAKEMRIPTYVLFDCDGDKLHHNNPTTAAAIKKAHENDNRAILEIVGGDITNLFPNTVCSSTSYSAWPNDLGYAVEMDAGPTWTQAGNKATAALGHVSGLKKNTLHIAERLNELHQLGTPLPTLDKLCADILAFAEAN